MSDSAVPAICAAFLGGAAAVFFCRARLFLARAASAEAEVVSVRAYRDGKSTRYAQMCRFAAEGQVVEVELKAGLPYQVGARFTVAFDRAKPDRIYTRATLYRPGVVSLILAVGMTGIWLASR